MFTKKQFAQLIAAIQVISLFVMPISAYAADYTTPISVGSGSTLEIKSNDYDNININMAEGSGACVRDTGVLKIYEDGFNNNTVSIVSSTKGVWLDGLKASGCINGKTVYINGEYGYGITADMRDGTRFDIGTDETENVIISALHSFSWKGIEI